MSWMKISAEKHQQRAQGHGGYYWTIKLHLNHAKWFTVLYFALIEIIILRKYKIICNLYHLITLCKPAITLLQHKYSICSYVFWFLRQSFTVVTSEFTHLVLFVTPKCKISFFYRSNFSGGLIGYHLLCCNVCQQYTLKTSKIFLLNTHQEKPEKAKSLAKKVEKFTLYLLSLPKAASLKVGLNLFCNVRA